MSKQVKRFKAVLPNGQEVFRNSKAFQFTHAVVGKPTGEFKIENKEGNVDWRVLGWVSSKGEAYREIGQWQSCFDIDIIQVIRSDNANNREWRKP